jgi:regulatory protein
MSIIPVIKTRTIRIGKNPITRRLLAKIRPPGHIVLTRIYIGETVQKLDSCAIRNGKRGGPIHLNMSHPESEKPTAKQLALARLTRREQSVAELVRYLIKKGYERAESAAAAAELVEEGWLDEKRYSAALARAQAARGKGPLALVFQLRQRGIRVELREAGQLLEEARPAAERDEAEAVFQLLTRRYRTLNFGDSRALARAQASMLRRGFSAGAVREALARLGARDGCEEPPR